MSHGPGHGMLCHCLLNSHCQANSSSLVGTSLLVNTRWRPRAQLVFWSSPTVTFQLLEGASTNPSNNARVPQAFWLRCITSS